MTSNTLDRYRTVVVVNADHIALKISLDLKEQSLDVQRRAFAGSKSAGYFYLHSTEEFPDMVYECVASPEGDDAIASVYLGHRIFNTPGELMSARENLISAIAAQVGLSVEGIGIDDPGRGRSLSLTELSTGQLIDTLAGCSSKSIIQTGGHIVAPAL
jgi:hypothetical protein